MEFILQTYNKDNQRLLADGPITKSKAILNYSDNTSDLKIKIELDGKKSNIQTALAALFQISKLGDKTEGEFKFTSRQADLKDSLSEEDITPEGVAEADDENGKYQTIAEAAESQGAQHDSGDIVD